MDKPNFTVLYNCPSIDGYVTRNRKFFKKLSSANRYVNTLALNNPIEADIELRDFNESDIPFLICHVEELPLL